MKLKTVDFDSYVAFGQDNEKRFTAGEKQGETTDLEYVLLLGHLHVKITRGTKTRYTPVEKVNWVDPVADAATAQPPKQTRTKGVPFPNEV